MADVDAVALANILVALNWVGCGITLFLIVLGFSGGLGYDWPTTFAEFRTNLVPNAFFFFGWFLVYIFLGWTQYKAHKAVRPYVLSFLGMQYVLILVWTVMLSRRLFIGAAVTLLLQLLAALLTLYAIYFHPPETTNKTAQSRTTTLDNPNPIDLWLTSVTLLAFCSFVSSIPLWSMALSFEVGDSVTSVPAAVGLLCTVLFVTLVVLFVPRGNKSTLVAIFVWYHLCMLESHGDSRPLAVASLVSTALVYIAHSANILYRLNPQVTENVKKRANGVFSLLSQSRK